MIFLSYFEKRCWNITYSMNGLELLGIIKFYKKFTRCDKVVPGTMNEISVPFALIACATFLLLLRGITSQRPVSAVQWCHHRLPPFQNVYCGILMLLWTKHEWLTRAVILHYKFMWFLSGGRSSRYCLPLSPLSSVHSLLVQSPLHCTH
jgi:hypothetical protein